MPIPGIASNCFSCNCQGVQAQLDAGDGPGAVVGDDDTGLCFEGDLVGHADENWIGADLPSEGMPALPWTSGAR